MLSQHLDRSSNVHIHTNMRAAATAAATTQLRVVTAAAALLFKCCAIYLYAKQYGNWSLDFGISAFLSLTDSVSAHPRVRIVIWLCEAAAAVLLLFLVAVVTDFSWQRKIWCDVLISKKNSTPQKNDRICTCPKKFQHKLCTPQNRSGLISKCVFIIYVNNDIIEIERTQSLRWCFLFYFYCFLAFYSCICRESIFLRGLN